MQLPENVSFPNDLVDARCACCGGIGMRRFYRVARVPVMSNLLVKTRDEALAFPTGRLDLAVCEACGFVGNLAFDESQITLDTDYEATQGFSPTFGSFAQQLATDWIIGHRLRGRNVLEIGCGQGEFLKLMAELGDCSCVGYDPTVIAGRVGEPRSGSVTLHKVLFTRDTPLGDADFVLCRHTLEHIAAPLDFLRMIRAAIGARRGVPLAIEVPDVLRVLEGAAFWDLFYEHCSYFSGASLDRCFAEADFHATSEQLVFGSQYLVSEALPGRKGGSPSPARVIAAARAFAEKLGDKLATLAEFTTSPGRWAVWGAGSKAAGLLATLDVREDVPVVDINPHKQNSFIPMTGQRVVAPVFLRDHRPDRVLIMNAVYEREITQQLAALGLSPRVVALA
jgi:SAM-dependent methyltransferase